MKIAPLLLIGGAAAALALGGKKKKKAAPKAPPNYVYYASGKNLFARGLLHAELLANGVNSTMYDQRDLADAYDDAWANADGLIVALDIANKKLAGAWAAAAPDSEYSSKDVAGTMAKPMTLEQLGTQGVQEAIALSRSAVA